MSAEVLTTELIVERLRRDGVRKTANALRKPPVPSRLLQELADLAEPTLAQQFVAAYPLSPSHLLENLARSAQDPEVFPFLATNPRTPPHLLSEFAVHENPEVRTHVATHPQLAARELLNLAQDRNVTVRRAVATNSSLRIPHHAALVADASPGVRLRLAAQSTLPAEVALVLAADTSTVVRTHTIAASTASDDLLLGWAASDEEDVQLALASRPDLPAPVTHLLLLSPFASVRRTARALVEPDTIELLHFVTVGEAEERAWVAARAPLALPLQRVLAQDPKASVRLALAANPSLDADIADYFLALADEAVCVALATNPVLNTDQVQALAATRLPAVLTALAYRDSLYDELVPFLLEHSPDFLRHWAIQQRPAVLTDAALARRLLAHPLPSVRALAVASHDWRRADLYEFARDRAPAVRLAAIRHPQAADELINDASLDASPEIAEAAQAVRAAREVAARTVKPTKGAAPVAMVPATRVEKSSSHIPAATRESFSAPLSSAASQPGLLKQLKRLFWQ
ncbi:hypothetical protein [Oleiharenicola lentus]|uniref:hypothetical protein n=1 Tax=Oleiharenicola lentus TaxID=2508720 RepID=UPI003F676F1E